jgi:hypothetical protein
MERSGAAVAVTPEAPNRAAAHGPLAKDVQTVPRVDAETRSADVADGQRAARKKFR